MSTLVLGATAGAFGYLYRKAEQIPRVELSSVLQTPDASGAPQNYLVVGIDNADKLAKNDPVRRQRGSEFLSDTIMVLRIDPAKKKASLLSLPRDLWVPYGSSGQHGRINAAISMGHGRPDILIGVLKDYFGIPIHHYIQVDLAGFRELVKAIDGVPIYFPYPARDQHSGLNVLETGCVTLDPVQALGYARSRYYDELKHGRWVRDPRSDLGRISRQQNFIRAALNRAVEKGARNPGTLNQLIDAGLGSVTIDDKLTTGDILDLAQRFRSFDPENLATFTVPVTRTFKGAADVVELVESQAEPILARFRGDTGSSDGSGSGNGNGTGTGTPTDIAPASVRLTILNGTGAQGQGSEVATALAGIGFIVVGRGDQPGYGVERTTILYTAGNRPAAELVSRWLVSGAELQEVPAGYANAGGPDSVVVITGSDWAGVRSSPSAPPSTSDTTASSSTTTTTGRNGSTTTTTATQTEGTTTTTAPTPAC
jgi:LCP family protein required for cell wall assembly